MQHDYTYLYPCGLNEGLEGKLGPLSMFCVRYIACIICRDKNVQPNDTCEEYFAAAPYVP